MDLLYYAAGDGGKKGRNSYTSRLLGVLIQINQTP